jgi:hypothetical protein
MRMPLPITQDIRGYREDESVDILNAIQRGGTDQPDKDLLCQILGLSPLANMAIEVAHERSAKARIEFALQSLGIGDCRPRMH